MNPIDNRRYLAIPAYPIAALLVLFPLVDTSLALMPMRVGEVAWRFGAIGLSSRALMTPLLGVLLAFAVALLLEQHSVLRTISVLTGLAAAVLLAVVLLFVLDAIQARAQVHPSARRGFDLAALIAIGKYGLAKVALLALAVGAWRASKQDRTAARHATSHRVLDGLIANPTKSA